VYHLIEGLLETVHFLTVVINGMQMKSGWCVMMRFIIGYVLGLASMTTAVSMAPAGEIEKVIKQYSNMGYTVVKELSGKKPQAK